MGSHPYRDQAFLPSDQVHSLEDPDQTMLRFPSIGAGEMAFALSFFVAAGSGRFQSLKTPVIADEVSSRRECGRLFRLLCSGIPSAEPPDRPRSGEITLPEAFWSLWQQFQGHDQQVSVCARVLGFHLLMENTGGAAVSPWLEPCAEDPRLVTLHPVVVEAMAVVPLSASGEVPEDRFVSTIKSLTDANV